LRKERERERDTGAFCMACVLGSGMLSEISRVNEWSISHALSLMVDASILMPFLKDFVVVKMWFSLQSYAFTCLIKQA